MPGAQVEAWASYDQTAKTARHFSNGGRVRNRRASDFARVPRNSSHGNNARRSLHGVDGRSLHFEVNGAPNVDRKGFFELLSLERGCSVKVHASTKVVESAEQKLSPTVRSDINNLFYAFFEETFEDSSTSKAAPGIGSCLKFIKSFDATMPWVQNYVKSEALLFSDLCLRGISQVYFQNNPLSGLLILIGLFLQSTRVAVHGVIAVVAGSLIALSLGFDRGLAQSGLFGYNAVLVGLALATFDSPEQHRGYQIGTAIAAIIFAAFSSILFAMMGKLLVPYTSPPLTLPFNVATITFLLAVANMGRLDMDSVREQRFPDYQETEVTGISAKEFFEGTLRGIGQVFLADNIISGALVLAGIAVSSRIAAIAAFVGSALGAATAVAIGVPNGLVSIGMFGFNASLSFTAMFMFYTPSKGAAILGTLAAIITVAGQQALDSLLEPWGLPFMTLPFCVVALPFIIIQGTTSLVIAVPLPSMTVPEDHLRRVSTLLDGFGLLKEAITPEAKTPLKRTHSSITDSVARMSEAIKSEVDFDKEDLKKYGRFSNFWNWRETKSEREMEKVRRTASLTFDVLDHDNAGHIYPDKIMWALQSSGLDDPEGLHFATLVLDVIDFDKSYTIERNEFVALALVGRALRSLRRDISRFFDFVDVDGDRCIDFEELDASLQYLRLPVLTENEKNMLLAISNTSDEDEGIDVVEFINFLSVSKIKELVEQHQHN